MKKKRRREEVAIRKRRGGGFYNRRRFQEVIYLELLHAHDADFALFVHFSPTYGREELKI
jgi:hypothetical protein